MITARCNVSSIGLRLLSCAAALVCFTDCSEDASPIPDLSGRWGRDNIFFEPPPSGPGPIVSSFRKPDGMMDIDTVAGDYTSPILKPEAADIVKERGEIILGGAAFPDPHNQCWPEPTPFTLSTQFGVQILQQEDEAILLYLADHKVRRIRMNVPHSAHVTPTWLGDSVGYYEGDTLVIDTVGQKVGPLSMVDLYGTPFSEALHVIERYRLIDGATARDDHQKHQIKYFAPGEFNPFSIAYGRGSIDPNTSSKGLQVEITVEDPVVFTMPWSARITYRRVIPSWPVLWPEAVCAENTREYYANKDTAVPSDDTPDF